MLACTDSAGFPVGSAHPTGFIHIFFVTELKKAGQIKLSVNLNLHPLYYKKVS